MSWIYTRKQTSCFMLCWKYLQTAFLVLQHKRPEWWKLLLGPYIFGQWIWNETIKICLKYRLCFILTFWLKVLEYWEYWCHIKLINWPKSKVHSSMNENGCITIILNTTLPLILKLTVYTSDSEIAACNVIPQPCLDVSWPWFWASTTHN